MKQISWIVLGWMLLLTPAHAASFDCSKANTNIERMICNNQELSDLDSRMDKAYQDALNAYDYYAGLHVKEDQKKWLNHTRRKCNDEACLKRTYLSRIDELNAPFARRPNHMPDVFIKDVVVKTQNGAALLINNPNERNDSFNSDIKRKGLKGQISQCKILIDIPVGTAHGNHSFGGLCALSENEKNSTVMICNDDMAGHFKMDDIDREVTKQELVDYVVSNCFGG